MLGLSRGLSMRAKESAPSAFEKSTSPPTRVLPEPTLKTDLAALKGPAPFDPWLCLTNPAEALKRQGYCEFTITVLEAKGLPAADTNGFSDPYVKMTLSKPLDPSVSHPKILSLSPLKRAMISVGTSTTQSRTLEPVWNESFVMHVHHPMSVLHLEVYDFDVVGYDDLLGEIIFPIKHLVSGQTVEGWFRILPSQAFEMQGAGFIRLRVTAKFTMTGELLAGCLPVPPRPKHLPVYDLNQLYANGMRMKLILWDEMLEKAAVWANSVLDWKDPIVSSLVLLGFWLLYFFPALILPFFFICFIALMMHTRKHPLPPLDVPTFQDRFLNMMEELETTQQLDPTDVGQGLAAGFKALHEQTLGGFVGIFTETFEGASERGALGAVTGLTSGVTGAVTGTFSGVGGFASSTLRGLANTPGALIYGRSSSPVRRRKKLSHVGDALLTGVEGFATSTLGGVASLVESPVQGFQRGGFSGMAVGLGTGAVDAVTGVVGGTLNLAADAIEGVAATPGAVLTGVTDRLKDISPSSTKNLENKKEDIDEGQETELELGPWLAFVLAGAPSHVKDRIRLAQKKSRKLLLKIETLRGILKWRSPATSWAVVATASVLLLLSAGTIVIDWLAFLLMYVASIVARVAPLVGGTVLLLHRTSLFELVARAMQGLSTFLGAGLNKKGLNKHKTYMAVESFDKLWVERYEPFLRGLRRELKRQEEEQANTQEPTEDKRQRSSRK